MHHAISLTGNVARPGNGEARTKCASDARSYVQPFGLGGTMTGGAVGRVIESRSDALPVGTAVLHGFGWRDLTQGPAQQFSLLPETGLPLSAFLGAAGMTGLTAYAGLKRVAALRGGDVVSISGAAGAVGSIAGQIARRLGASRVLGSAGSAAKVSLLKNRYGYDEAFNYKDAPVRQQLGDLTPDGIDVYFDNVGGAHLEPALDRLNTGGRAALCGAISRVDGIGNAVDAFLDMMNGANTGKMLVRP